MNAAMAGRGMKSTINPRRRIPMPNTIAPTMTARAEATTWPGMPGAAVRASLTMSPTRSDMTATGPMVMSFEVAKNQYSMTPTNDEYSPNCGSRSASLAYAIPGTKVSHCIRLLNECRQTHSVALRRIPL